MNNNNNDDILPGKRRSFGDASGGMSRSSSTRGPFYAASAASTHPAGIIATPSKPKGYNPYARQPHTPPTSVTPVKNPYLKKKKASSSSVAQKSPGSGAKRQLDQTGGGISDSDNPLKRLVTNNTSLNLKQPSAVNLSYDFDDAATNNSDIDPNKTYSLYFDGGSRGNPGISGAGMALFNTDEAEEEVWSGKQYIGNNKTNNESEYISLITGLKCAKSLGVQRIIVKGDSKLVVNQVLGKWNCNKDHLRHLLQQVIDVKQHFKHFDISHVRREENKRADMLANMAMDDQVTDLGCCSAIVHVGDTLVTPPISQDEEEKESGNLFEARVTDDTYTGNNNTNVEEEELCHSYFRNQLVRL